ncbi:MAG: TraB/GumN family protein [Saprospiraceae bacterium]|nr:TraB/GumN family protein [Saprospiraceae bacterium]
MTFVLSAPGCKTTKSQISDNDYKPLENALLWKITGKELKEPSYLYGTIHIIGAEDFFLPKGTMTALEASKKVVFEIDVKDMTDISSLMGMMNKIFMSDGQTLKDLLNEGDYDLVKSHFQKIGIPIFMLERMKPMFLSVFAYGDMDPSGLQSGSMKSYEMELFEMAKNSGKETGGLETVDFQIGLFDEIPYEAQAKMLVESIKSSDSNDDSFAKMTEMYVNQNIEKMIEMISEDGNEISGFEDQLLYQRNKNWIPLILNASKSEPTFFAVGAGHLAGPKGVIHLLRNAGLTVKPVL